MLMKKKKFVFFTVFFILCIIIPLSLLFSFSLLDQDGENHLEREFDADNPSSRESDITKKAESNISIPTAHTISRGETLRRIADKYGLSITAIVRYNKIIDTRLLNVGASLYLPAGIEKKRNYSLPGESTADIDSLPKRLTINAFNTSGNLPLSVDFFPVLDIPDHLSCVWDFGTDYFSYKEQPTYTYLAYGTYNVRLSVGDHKGREVLSRPLAIQVHNFHCDAEEGLPFYTIDHVNGNLDISEKKWNRQTNVRLLDMDTEIMQHPILLQQTNDNVFTAIAPGYAKVTLINKGTEFGFYLFVSPFPSQHSVEPEFNWYKTQFDTGMYGNCGPACVAIAVHWATGKNITVEKSREEIGLPIKSGALSYHHMMANFDYHRIKSRLTIIDSFDDMKRIIDRGSIAIILFNTTYIQPVDGDERLVFVDRFYPDTTGHYVVIKGYSLDRKYFIVYDPIPGDWQTNSLRYADGVSMIGRNRYFLVEQIFQSIKGKNVLEIARKR
jgi:PKD repeat protein